MKDEKTIHLHEAQLREHLDKREHGRDPELAVGPGGLVRRVEDFTEALWGVKVSLFCEQTPHSSSRRQLVTEVQLN